MSRKPDDTLVYITGRHSGWSDTSALTRVGHACLEQQSKTPQPLPIEAFVLEAYFWRSSH